MEAALRQDGPCPQLTNTSGGLVRITAYDMGTQQPARASLPILPDALPADLYGCQRGAINGISAVLADGPANTCWCWSAPLRHRFALLRPHLPHQHPRRRQQ